MPVATSSPEPSHQPDSAVGQLDVHPQLEATLFAAEPMLLSPSNIDIDDRGRVWVCEIVNYRSHKGRRSEGDRILILEDTNGDGHADKTKVFYQGTDIDSPHGVCVLGNQVIVSAGPHVLCFIDKDGDDQPDEKVVWFSGIQGVQHDHGIHAFTFGPDGKLYFNFGNAGEQLQDAEGRPIIDLAGHVVKSNRQPYQQGMVFRCNSDLSDLETLAWNFRNNWMVTVDSFGSIWQSDNDDDGNRGVRINYVMEFGNYGYRDEMTGAGWQTERIGMAPDVPTRHWHQNDPGVVPNLLLTGAGSPTGIAVYEGDALPVELRGQLLHCDAGPSVTRAYLVDDAGAGYTARSVNLLQGARDPWFRPSDIKVAPDGSLIVADWYDPGVGGHRMGDLDRGRLFRLTLPGQGGVYHVPPVDVSTTAGAIQALRSPNNATRYLAWTALHAMGESAEAELVVMSQDAEPHLRARALWLLGKIAGRGEYYVSQAIGDRDARVRMMGLRLARQLADVDALTIVTHLISDESAQVRRECAIALHGSQDARVPDLWARLARQYDGRDRWYLEALGIAAERQWDHCLAAWLESIHNDWNTASGRDIVWRSRSQQTPELLRQIINDPATPAEQLPRYLRAFDFLSGPSRDTVVGQLAFHNSLAAGASRQLVMSQAMARLNPDQLRSDPQHLRQFNSLLDSLRGTREFVELVQKFQLQDRFDDVLDMAIQHADQSEGIDAARVLLASGQEERLRRPLQQHGTDEQLAAIAVLGRSADNRALPLLTQVIADEASPVEARRDAVGSITALRAGAEWLLQQSEAGKIPAELMQAVAAALHHVPWSDLQDRVASQFPLSPAKDNRPLPALRELALTSGDSQRGEAVFRTTGTCVKCHVVNGQGTQVGPELSEIGGKLSREALFESILYPSAGISHNYETYTVELNDGNVVTGVLVSETDDQLELKTNEGIVRRFGRADIDQLVKQPISLMPADLHQSLTQQELVDLVEYLLTLKKVAR